mmetsp:Transcript_8165/g.12522  ORF Transcript_8165/g.12522 Transcript_8165/m.12522 type:complete len:409 (+) Transcript_8165:150-1376(+)|eukprot:CAMPEP_0178933938 /NCGR_PEP_ID=MMETSP0786-20121207/23585_1 /TAXON_ID=186022 /ORGANISM="Thalassionema frauenfeldii, Strain CCMP 1798" /LENGTH=408 /DNA_ID=CAMNT_0020611665 /DNA_START=46 /DNA_END=1272 /DNA_ORIENTATION=-
MIINVLVVLIALTSLNSATCFTANINEKRVFYRHGSRLREEMEMASVQDDETEANEVLEKSSPSVEEPKSFGEILRDITRNLAELSLKDYKWRSNLFKEMSADRLLESSLARMRGDSPSYVRPMDADDLGPLGIAEESAVTWLSRVIEEEGKRAEMMVEADGAWVRPMDVESGGPLGEIESMVVGFFDRIRASEKLRTDMGILRPKDLDESQRGPLGDAEYRLYQALKELATSETERMEQSVQRGGEVVRPMEIPGPLGEVEAAVMAVIDAERKRKEESASGDSFVRPKDALIKGPLGEAEQETIRAFRRLNEEERERLRGILKKLEENRPMELNRNSILGFLEAVVVGIIRAPKMIASVWDRAAELLRSEIITLENQEEKSSDTVKRIKTPVKLNIPPLEDDVGEFE